jgi:ectoine hydroxylase-related dioxygenase (phytanoyl-CoA dioxygenase family)
MKKKTIFRRTYLHLSEVLPLLENHLKLVKNKELFLTAFSSFFLLEKPLFDNIAQERNSVQTFYANHYLREILKLEALPAPELLYNYCKSVDFSDDISKVAKLEREKKKERERGGRQGECSANIIPRLICQEFSPRTLTASDELENIIIQFVNSASKQSGKYLKSNLNEPSEEVFSALKNDGFYIQEDFLDQETVRKIKKLTSLVADSEKKQGQGYFYGEKVNSQRIYNLVSKHPAFVDLICHPYMMSLLDRVYDRPTLHEKFTMNSMTAHIVAPGAAALPMHIDSVVPDPIPDSMIRFIAILALDDFTSDNGATELVQGSHKFLRRPTRSEVISTKAEKAICKAGSLIMFDGATWHRSTANTSEYSRMGLMLSYAASYFLEISGEEEHLTVIPKKILDSFSPKMKQIVGYQRAIKKGALYVDEELYNKDLNTL